jgi:hypothetical protein
VFLPGLGHRRIALANGLIEMDFATPARNAIATGWKAME